MSRSPKPLLLRAETIFLKTLEASDVTEAYVNWMNDPDVVQFTESRFASHTKESVTKFVEDCRQDPGVLLLGIFDSASGLHLGNIKLGPVNQRHSLADVGIIIGRREFWGRGLPQLQ
jgi:ribosomal-protein-alanine N-acetyltransferase